MPESFEFGKHNFVRVPPDSTGKFLGAHLLVTVTYATGTIAFALGDEVVGGTSQATGEVVSVRGTVADGKISVVLVDESAVNAFSVGEQLRVGGVTRAIVAATANAHVPDHVVVGANSPLNGQFVDRAGAAYVRFSEGAPQADAFGLLRSTSPSQLAQYVHRYGTDDDLWQNQNVGTGTVTHLPAESSVALDVGTASGDRARRTTHRYHPYQAGFGQTMLMTFASGDAGKANVRRRWGYFDDRNGCFFELSGTTLRTVVRADVTGSVVDSAVDQQSWNGDQVDGQGGPRNLSGMMIDVSTINLYWIDFQWLGGGQVRFGVYSETGSRLVLHTVRNANSSPLPYMGQGNLPVRIEVENVGISASPSRGKITCASVSTDGPLVATRERRSRKWTVETPAVTAGDLTDAPVVSFRPSLVSDGNANRHISIPERVAVYVTGQPVLFKIKKRGTLTGASFVAVPESHAAEYDVSATALVSAEQILSWTLDPGSHNLDLPGNFGILSEGMFLDADGVGQKTYTFTARSLVTGQNAQVRAFPTWIDIE